MYVDIFWVIGAILVLVIGVITTRIILRQLPKELETSNLLLDKGINNNKKRKFINREGKLHNALMNIFITTVFKLILSIVLFLGGISAAYFGINNFNFMVGETEWYGPLHGTSIGIALILIVLSVGFFVTAAGFFVSYLRNKKTSS